ncbi:MAG: tetratricopeptide repeat protein, partial [Nitrospiraceae bacterium]
DVWLQTAQQVKVGSSQGVSVSELIIQVRLADDGKAAFEGELVLILDACYSGQGTISQGLTLGDLGRHTTILTSSTAIQPSFSLKQAGLPAMSAFTYAMLQGLGPDWPEADSDHDGLLRWEELKVYITARLRSFHEQGALTQSMTPNMLTTYSEGFVTYRRDQVRLWGGSYRENLTTQAMNVFLASPFQTVDPSPKTAPTMPREAQVLAQHLTPAPDDYYAQAVKAMAEGHPDIARALFAKAEIQSQERASQAASVQQQAQAVQQEEKAKQGAIYLARARMESYAGKFTESFAWYQEAVAISPPTTAELMNEIGLSGLRAGKYPEAEPYLEGALHQREQALDPTHLDVGTSLNNLAVLYDTQGKYAEAEPLYQRALRITETALGPNHPSVAIRLNNLALLYQAQGKYAEAKPLYQRALRITETALGPNHPSVAIRLNNLAELYRAQGKYAEAEPLYQRALQIDEAALGADHPSVAIRLNNLALLYKAQGKYPEAERFYQRSYWIFYDRLGPKHPYVLMSFGNYQQFLEASGQPHSDDDVMSKLQGARPPRSSAAAR